MTVAGATGTPAAAPKAPVASLGGVLGAVGIGLVLGSIAKDMLTDYVDKVEAETESTKIAAKADADRMAGLRKLATELGSVTAKQALLKDMDEQAAAASLAGNNGLRSITAHLHTQDYLRVRIGIGKPPSKERGAGHVLSKVPPHERELLDIAVRHAADAVEVLLYVRDQKDLFARVCGYFDSRGLSIMDAKIHTTRHGYALDTFLITDNGRSPHYRELLTRVEKELTDWIAAVAPLPEPVKGRLSRHSRHFPVSPAVYLQPDERGRQYLLSLTATDRVGLLYAITRVLAQHEVNVHTARINTLGERVEDVFLIDGAVLATNKGQIQLEQALLEALTP
jgi:UTP:GlnB (protein PII) uridylyltransferase